MLQKPAFVRVFTSPLSTIPSFVDKETVVTVAKRGEAEGEGLGRGGVRRGRER